MFICQALVEVICNSPDPPLISTIAMTMGKDLIDRKPYIAYLWEVGEKNGYFMKIIFPTYLA